MSVLNQVDAVLFDMDGVLADTEPLHVLSWEKILSQLGLPFPEKWFVPWVGIPDGVLADALVSQHRLGLTVADLLKEKRDAYRIIQEECLRPLPGIRDRVDRLSALPLAVVTSSGYDDAMNTLRIVGLSDVFDEVVTAESVKKHKPCPEPYLKAIECLKVRPERCVVVEDSVVGVDAGLAANCTVLAVATTYPEVALQAAHSTFAATVDALDWILGQVET